MLDFQNIILRFDYFTNSAARNFMQIEECICKGVSMAINDERTINYVFEF